MAVLAELNEVRYALMRHPPNTLVDLRDYIPDGSASWQFFSQAGKAFGASVPRVNVVARIDDAVARLEAGAAAAPPVPELHLESATPLRQLTVAGIAEAQEFLAHLREHPGADRTPPKGLLFGDRCSAPFDSEPEIMVVPKAFATRREAGAYLSPLLRPVRLRIIEDAGVWSWLGMYYLEHIAPQTLSPNNMTLIFESAVEKSNAGRSQQQVYRHYLWGSWQIYERHGESAAFLLDQRISSWDDLSQRSFGTRRVFTSRGVVQVMLRLYTTGSKKRRGYVHDQGGLRHLLRVLPQLELTYDVYGMEPEALLRVLPQEFQRWVEPEA